MVCIGVEMEDLILAGEIRNWVFIPILVIIISVSILRANIQGLIGPSSHANVEEVHQQHVLQASQNLLKNHHMLPNDRIRHRVNFYIHPERGIFSKLPVRSFNPAMPQMMDSSKVISMSKSTMSIIPHILIMTWIQTVFSGFLLVRLPFSLTAGFTSMLQRDILLDGLSSSYVSSLSWYFTAFIGLRGFTTIFLDAGSQMSMMALGNPLLSQLDQANPNLDALTAYRNMRDHLRLTFQLN